MNTYTLCKKIIENKIRRNELEASEIAEKLDVFLLGNRISEDEFSELLSMLESE